MIIKTPHPDVLNIGRNYRKIGISTPTTLMIKGDLLLHPNRVGEKVAIVAADDLRCTTTLLTAFAAGVSGVMVTPKSGMGGNIVKDAERISKRLGLSLVQGGELHGKPIPNGVIGNSPRTVDPTLLNSKMLLFYSTNFGSLYMELTERLRRFNQSGGVADGYILSFANVDAVARRLNAQNYSRIFVATGGFYDVISIEDVVVGGMLLNKLGTTFEEADDEARVMMLCAAALPGIDQRLSTFQTNWIGRSLALFGAGEDVAAVVSGEGIDRAIFEAMHVIVPQISWIDGLPIIFPIQQTSIDREDYTQSTLDPKGNEDETRIPNFD